MTVELTQKSDEEAQREKPRPHKPSFWTRERLAQVSRLYWEEQLNIREIAERLGKKEGTVRSAFKYYKIPVRSHSDSLKLAHAKGLWDRCGWKQPKKDKDGYIWVYVDKDSPFYSMSYKGLVLEHRLIMAQHLGRCLDRNEFVHHRNGKRDDNELSNLFLTTPKEHPMGYKKGFEDGYRKVLQLLSANALEDMLMDLCGRLELDAEEVKMLQVIEEERERRVQWQKEKN